MYISKVWEKFVGNADEFTVENRVFNAISVFTYCILFTFLIVNILLRFVPLMVLSCVLLVVQTIFYYLSRFKKYYKSSFVMYGFISYMALIAAFFFNSGSFGPTLYIFFLTFHLLITFTSPRLHKLWVALHLVVTFSLLTLEYLRPGIIPNGYQSRWQRYIDYSVSYVFILAFIYFATIYLRRMLSREKNLAEERAEEIQKYSERMMSQNHTLEKINQEKDKMFSVISHDLRSPLNTIQSYLEMMAVEQLDEKDRKNIEQELLLLTRNTSDMLTNLLSWSKSQMEGVILKLTKINLAETLRNTLEVQKLIAHKKDVHFDYDLNPDIYLMADKDMLQLVIRNLVNNAVKFTPSGGNIIVSSSISGGDCRLSIKDNGIGISKDQQKELFSLKSKPTYGTMNEKGVGLGLLLCKEFIELQKGRIWFSSTAGLGTTFYVSLPIA